jgi:phospholipase C
MGDTQQRQAHIKDAIDFFHALDNGQLPSVAYVKPDSLVDGHPASSKLDLFEAMIQNIVDHINFDQRKDTVLFITFDEGGGFDTPGNAIGYAMHRSRSHDAVIRVYDPAGNVIATHEHAGDFVEP